MHRLFGKKKEVPPPPSLGDAAGSINERVKIIDDKIKGLEDELRKFKEALKKTKGAAAESIKRRAMDVLKRKKMYEQQRDQLAGQAFNIEQTAFAIESVKDNQQTVLAMQAGMKEMKKQNQKINLNEIENMQDDLADMFEDMNEVNDILGRSYNTDGIDDCDLDAELACLGDELELGDMDSTPSYLSSGSSLPSNPTSTILPSNVPVSAVGGAGAKLDEYGLPMSA